MEILQTVHSYMAYIVLAILFWAVVNAIRGLAGNRIFDLHKDFRISPFCTYSFALTIGIGSYTLLCICQWLERYPGLGHGGLKFRGPAAGCGTPGYQYCGHCADHHRLDSPQKTGGRQKEIQEYCRILRFRTAVYT